MHHFVPQLHLFAVKSANLCFASAEFPNFVAKLRGPAKVNFLSMEEFHSFCSELERSAAGSRTIPSRSQIRSDQEKCRFSEHPLDLAIATILSLKSMKADTPGFLKRSQNAGVTSPEGSLTSPLKFLCDILTVFQ